MDQPIDRRGFVRTGIAMTSLIGGLTLATARVEAQVIDTDTTGLEAGQVQVPVPDGTIPAYYARPQGAGPFPLILVNEEIFGVHHYIADICRRLAKLGYAAIAPEIYARSPGFPAMTDPDQIFRDVILRTPDAQIMSDLDHAIAFAEANHGDAKRLGTVGFCRGGRTVWLYAAHNPQLRAAVAFYGPIGGTRTDIQPRTAADSATDIKCPLLGLYGAQDTSIDAKDVQALAARARAAGRTVEIVIYPDAGHGFHADYRPSYVRADAEDGWQRMLAWFHRYGVA